MAGKLGNVVPTPRSGKEYADAEDEDSREGSVLSLAGLKSALGRAAARTRAGAALVQDELLTYWAIC